MSAVPKEKEFRAPKESDLSAGGALRHEIFNKIQPILLATELINDSRARLLIQASCLDVITALESIVSRFELDRRASSQGAIGK